MFNNKIEGMNMPPPTQNFTIKDTTSVECPECKNTVFQNGVIFRKVNKILAGTDKGYRIGLQADEFFNSRGGIRFSPLLKQLTQKDKHNNYG